MPPKSTDVMSSDIVNANFLAMFRREDKFNPKNRVSKWKELSELKARSEMGCKHWVMWKEEDWRIRIGLLPFPDNMNQYDWEICGEDVDAWNDCKCQL